MLRGRAVGTSNCRKQLFNRLLNDDANLSVQMHSTGLVNSKMEAKIQELKEGIEKKKKELEQGTSKRKELESQLEEAFMELEGRH